MYNRYYSKKSKSGKRKVGAVKRALGNLKAAKRGNDVATFTVNFTHPFVLSGDTYSTTSGNVHLGVQALNIWDLLSRTDNFKAFRNMYDQCKIDYVGVKLQVTNSTITTNNANQMYDIYTAWDRTGVSYGDVIPYVENSKIKGIGCVLNDKISTYNGVEKLQLNAFQRWHQYKSIWPTNGQELPQYVNTYEVAEWRDAYNTEKLYYPFKESLDDVNAYNQFLNMNNPGILVENGKYNFKPTLLVGAFTTNNNTSLNVAETNVPLTTSTKILMTGEFKVVLTFRGVRGAQSIS